MLNVFQASSGQLYISWGEFIHNNQRSINHAGGALTAVGASTTVNCSSVKFSANTGVAGGAVANSGATTLLHNCTFDANTAISGGALLVSSGKVTLSGGIVYNNTVKTIPAWSTSFQAQDFPAEIGGGICAVAGLLAMFQVRIEMNSASSGGGLAAAGAKVYSIPFPQVQERLQMT